MHKFKFFSLSIFFIIDHHLDIPFTIMLCWQIANIDANWLIVSLAMHQQLLVRLTFSYLVNIAPERQRLYRAEWSRNWQMLLPWTFIVIRLESFLIRESPQYFIVCLKLIKIYFKVSFLALVLLVNLDGVRFWAFMVGENRDSVS